MNNLEYFRQQKDVFFRTSPHSPLTAEQQQEFDGLNYFPENPSLNLKADVEVFDEQEHVQIQTNTGEVQSYERYGRFHFDIEGNEAALTIFRNENGYFLPFADSLSGEETYGAGRYLEPEELPDGRFHVDFNMAYNPYCAYNPNWVCPITPPENRLDVPLRAGEKVFETHD
jgi:uncharacterized protein (DUF1684 family)